MDRLLSSDASLSLVPINNDAWKTLQLPQNARHVCSLPGPLHQDALVKGIEIGVRTSFDGTSCELATIGRRGDVVLDNSARLDDIHCCLDFVPGSLGVNLVMGGRRSKVSYYVDFNEISRYGGSALANMGGFGAHKLRCNERREFLMHHTHKFPEIHLTNDEVGTFKFKLVWHLQNVAYVMAGMGGRRNVPQRIVPKMHLTRIHGAHFAHSARDYENSDKFIYTVIRDAPLGRGGQGTVFKVASEGKVFAMKQIQRPPTIDSREFELIKKEASALRQFDHPNIIKIVKVQWAPDCIQILMPIQQGNAAQFNAMRPFRESVAMTNSFFFQCLQGIACVHSENMVHGDLKPGNILYDMDGDSAVFKVADFGLVTLEGDPINSVAGTPGFTAPERSLTPRVTLTAKADMYSFFLTIADLLNLMGFNFTRLQSRGHPVAIILAAELAGQRARDYGVRQLTARDPNERPSATELLAEVFPGMTRGDERLEPLF